MPRGLTSGKEGKKKIERSDVRKMNDHYFENESYENV